MKLHLNTEQGSNLITGYRSGEVKINHQSYQQNVIVTPQQISLDWPIKAVTDIQNQHLSALIDFQPEIIIIGCGEQHHIIHPKLTVPLIQANIAIESMTTAAACRTYNILMAEGRKVLAALLV